MNMTAVTRGSSPVCCATSVACCFWQRYLPGDTQDFAIAHDGQKGYRWFGTRHLATFIR
ncbi:hypothetical protein EHW99_1916 [Erwinia amylovora]|uniref:Uncharacterized protein n=2 Tax=Erwinia amylovora TaxID=552 RepID=A0A830ZSS0_ERWAM|nr:hypothetical protein EaACW_1673 [Erwinia amylovora ACW56400]QJQ54620.1 hypothetical protein EHX00_1916 [Erwinia amylovora]CBA20617.1 hypothetical protein predicted by Glimmer/Critica [Erwinia amylovora CFBP1430]CCO78520.1 hypothetical protein BN432_1718 [Erwinia amylovora Ea356]CCO82313.1 hypothetical protein BN433_1739 [Erwinia amylovora Ea266]CCO86101.1 hypothetical protein BN434_1709 [Erwinia amylovora CFBP 2585]CCO89891.1 hypothetical protein BN435_1716 [Erwinia amylovora 01SFR-BO]CCO